MARLMWSNRVNMYRHIMDDQSHPIARGPYESSAWPRRWANRLGGKVQKLTWVINHEDGRPEIECIELKWVDVDE